MKSRHICITSSRTLHTAFPNALMEPVRGVFTERTRFMRDDHDFSNEAPSPSITLSRWINRPYPPLSELLSACEVVRLTRRPRWLLTGLSLIGQFPKEAKFRGRRFGWWRKEVLEWMTSDLNIALETHERLKVSRCCTCAHPHQVCLPLEHRECRSHVVTARDPSLRSSPRDGRRTRTQSSRS